MSVDVSVKFELPDWNNMSEKAHNDIPLLIASTLQTQRGMIFDKEGAYNGRQKWAPLKFRQGQILKNTGTLSKSIGPRTNGIIPIKNEGTILNLRTNVVQIGTSIAYAKVHDEGATIVPKSSKGVLCFQIPVYTKTKSGATKQKGTKTIFAKKVVIPKRNFSDLNDMDINELTDTVENYYYEKLL